MIRKWDIRPDPTAKNKDRHKLLIKGEMKDIFYIVKKLGGVCSRPEKSKGDFNFTIYLSRADTKIMGKLKEVTKELSSPESAKRKGPASFEEPKIHLQKPVVEKPVEKPAAPAEQKPTKPPIKKEEEKEVEKTQIPPFPKKEKEAEKEPAMPARQKEEKIAETKEERKEPDVGMPSMGVSVPSVSSRIKREEPLKEKPPETEKSSDVDEKIKNRLLKTKWALELPLNPMLNFENLVAGSHNRFAHAAAMAVVDNPGMMYNPLLIFGVPGTGKTHFSYALLYAMAPGLGYDKIFITDGLKFSKGVDIAIKEGFANKIEKIFEAVQVLIIDDIHLVLLSEKSKKLICKILDSFMQSNKQLIFTSLFTPKALEGLEDNLGFQITQGWMVDLKVPSKENYREIIGKMMGNMQIEIEDEKLNFFFVNNLMPLGEAERILWRVKKLEKFMVNAASSPSHGELLEMLLGGGKPSGEMPGEEDYEKSESFRFESTNKWFKWGIFCPKNEKRNARWVIYNLHETAKEIGVPVDWQQVFIEEYDSDQTFGVPFKIGDISTQRKVNGVIVLGSQSTTVLGSNDEEFRHLTGKILDSFLVKMGWIKFAQLKDRDAYIRVLMELI